MSDGQMYGVFGPGDGKPVAVYADHDEAAREGRKRFGDGAFVAPVSLTAKELAAAAELNPALVPAATAASNPRLEQLRAEARAELQNELIKEQLKEEMRGDVEAEVRGLFSQPAPQPDPAREALREAAVASHEAVTGEELPEGQLPPSGVHSAGPAPAAAGKSDQEMRQPIPAVSEPGQIVEATATAELPANVGRMNVAELRALAAERGVSVAEDASKADIRKALGAE